MPRHTDLQPTPPGAIARLAKWLSNDNPPSAAYSALMAGRLIALEKNPGIRHIAMEKYCDDSLLISVAKGEAQETCGIDQLCGGLQAEDCKKV